MHYINIQLLKYNQCIKTAQPNESLTVFLIFLYFELLLSAKITDFNLSVPLAEAEKKQQ